MKVLNKDKLQRLREIYKPGVMLKLISTIEDPYNPLPAGLCGECCGVDDMGHILMKWSNGSSLSLIPEVDYFLIEKEASK